MYNLLKDVAVLLFSIGDDVEKKAAEFKKCREERYKKFEGAMKEKGDEIKSRLEKEADKAKQKISDFTSRIGLVSKKEIDELKEAIDKLNTKIDSLNKTQ